MTANDDDVMAAGTWDLADVTAERTQPKVTKSIYLNEAASYAKSELTKELAKAKEPEQVKAIEKTIAEVDKQLEATKYQVVLTAVPSRMREDIHSKALHKFPIRPDLMGRDDHQNSLDRLEHENLLIWTAQIVDVINPKGQHKMSWTQDEMAKFIPALPSAAQTAIDNAIQNLTKAAEEFTVESQNIDF